MKTNKEFLNVLERISIILNNLLFVDTKEYRGFGKWNEISNNEDMEIDANKIYDYTEELFFGSFVSIEDNDDMNTENSNIKVLENVVREYYSEKYKMWKEDENSISEFDKGILNKMLKFQN